MTNLGADGYPESRPLEEIGQECDLARELATMLAYFDGRTIDLQLFLPSCRLKAMLSIVRFLGLALLAATALPEQDRLWDAYNLGQTGAKGQAALIEELRQAAGLAESPRLSEPFFYAQTLLDALIEDGATVPWEIVLPFRENWPAESVILLARNSLFSLECETALLKWRAKPVAAATWMAIGDLLYRAGSARFMAKTVSEAEFIHYFTVRSTAEPRFGCGGVFGCTLPETQLPAGAPPIGLYYLALDNLSGGKALTEAAPIPVYFMRATAQQKGIVVGPYCNPREELRRTNAWTSFLGARTGLKWVEAYSLFTPSTTLVWSDYDTLQREMNEKVQAQALSLHRLLEAHRAELGEVSGMRICLRTKVFDERDERDGPIPLPAAVEFVLD